MTVRVQPALIDLLYNYMEKHVSMEQTLQDQHSLSLEYEYDYNCPSIGVLSWVTTLYQTV